MEREICLHCARGRRAGEWGCPSCGCDLYGTSIEGDRGPVQKEKAEQLAGLLDWVTMPRGALGVMSGPKGFGKTTILLQALKSGRRGPWVVTNEMAPGLVRAYARRLGVRLRGVSQSRVEDLEDGTRRVELDLPTPPPDLILLDSATGSGEPLLALQALREVCELHGCKAMAILQVTTTGDARGGPQVEHAPDLVVRLEIADGVRQLVVEKNRFGPEGVRAYQLTAEGARLPQRAGYYTIEGSAPRYKLLQHPNPQARYNALYRAVERALLRDESPMVALPQAPLATCALESPLYDLGFIEPEDVVDRARFAEANGLSYYFPRSA